MPQGVDPEDNGSSGGSGTSGNSLWFETLAQMQAAPGSGTKQEAYQVETNANYEWFPGDTTTINGWTVLGNTGGVNGRWKLISGTIEIRPIDGINDDSVRINSAIVALSGVRKLGLMPGFTIVAGLVTLIPFIATTPIRVEETNLPLEIYGIQSGMQIHGAPPGPGTRILWKGALATNVFSVSLQETVILRDFAVDNSALGGSLATHGIWVKGASDQIQIKNVLMFPEPGLGFTVAGIEIGSAAGGQVGKSHIENCTLRNCAIGTKITSVICHQSTHNTHVDCGTCTEIGTATSTAYEVSYFGCTFEARIGQTGGRVVRGNGVSFYGCQFDAWDNTHFGFEILNTAALADSISFYGCKFTGNTVPSGVKLDFVGATVNFDGCYFSGFTTSGIKNTNNRYLNVTGCHGDDNLIPLVDDFSNGSVRAIGNDVNGTLQIDRIGGSTGVAIKSFIELGGGTQSTTGLLRFPKPSEQGTLAVFRREASAVDIPFIMTDASSSLFIGDLATGAFGSLVLRSSTDIHINAPSFVWRDATPTTRATWTIAAAMVLTMPVGGSFTIQNVAVVRFTTVNAKPSITGALSAVTDANAKTVMTSIIAALKVTTGVDIATDGTT